MFIHRDLPAQLAKSLPNLSVQKALNPWFSEVDVCDQRINLYQTYQFETLKQPPVQRLTMKNEKTIRLGWRKQRFPKLGFQSFWTERSANRRHSHHTTNKADRKRGRAPTMGRCANWRLHLIALNIDWLENSARPKDFLAGFWKLQCTNRKGNINPRLI